jgi:hypothetical protein
MHADADFMSAPPAAAQQQACSTQITSSSGAKSDHSTSRYYAAFLAFVLVFSSALSCFHVHLVLEAAATITVTFDETAHVGAGVTFWKYKDFRLNPENGVLPQLIAGGGVILGRAGADYSIPSFQQQAWRYSDCWTFGFQLLHESGNDLRSILHDGRRGIAVRENKVPCIPPTHRCVFAGLQRRHGVCNRRDCVFRIFVDIAQPLHVIFCCICNCCICRVHIMRARSFSHRPRRPHDI